jgi:hypothetical protein
MRTPRSGEGGGSFLRSNTGLVYLAVLLAVPAYLLGFLIGLSPAFTTPLLVLVVAGTFAVLRWRKRSGNAFGDVTTSGVVAAIAVFAVIQLVPYGRTHANPAVRAEPKWPDAATRALVVRACYDCHSNETKYPWYANLAPVSWALAEHVDEGRAALNFSEFDSRQEGADEVVDEIRDGSMPPSYFTRFGLHPTAKLSDAEKQQLIAALRAMPEFREHGGRGDD